MRVALASVLLLLAACGGARIDPAPAPAGPPAAERVAEAEAAIAAWERRLAEVQALPPAERRQRQLGLGPPLAELVDLAAGTKLENKALYWLICWQQEFRRPRDERALETLLDRLDRAPSPAYVLPGRLRRCELRLRQGRLADARRLAEQLDAEAPELGAGRLVAFQERVGRPAPLLAGADAGGAPCDPAGAPEPALALLFTGPLDAETRFLIERWLPLAVPGRLRLVVVTGEPNVAAVGAAAARWRQQGAVDVLWANPAADGMKAWKDAWTPPGLPVAVLLGPAPARTVAAVRIGPEDAAEMADPSR